MTLNVRRQRIVSVTEEHLRSAAQELAQQERWAASLVAHYGDKSTFDSVNMRDALSALYRELAAVGRRIADVNERLADIIAQADIVPPSPIPSTAELMAATVDETLEHAEV